MTRNTKERRGSKVVINVPSRFLVLCYFLFLDGFMAFFIYIKKPLYTTTTTTTTTYNNNNNNNYNNYNNDDDDDDDDDDDRNLQWKIHEWLFVH